MHKNIWLTDYPPEWVAHFDIGSGLPVANGISREDPSDDRLDRAPSTSHSVAPSPRRSERAWLLLASLCEVSKVMIQFKKLKIWIGIPGGPQDRSRSGRS